MIGEAWCGALPGRPLLGGKNTCFQELLEFLESVGGIEDVVRLVGGGGTQDAQVRLQPLHNSEQVTGEMTAAFGNHCKHRPGLTRQHTGISGREERVIHGWGRSISPSVETGPNNERLSSLSMLVSC